MITKSKVANKCKVHGTEMKGYFRKRDNKVNHFECVECRSENMKRIRKEGKKFLVQYFGGKCIRCSYDKCLNALTFHHKDPSKKEFQMSGNIRSLKKLFNEAKKCELLCHNCHAEEHAKPEDFEFLGKVELRTYLSIENDEMVINRKELPNCLNCGNKVGKHSNKCCSRKCSDAYKAKNRKILMLA